MKFSWNLITYEVPDGIDIDVEVDDEHADFNFIKDGEVVAMYGGTDNDGNALPTWDDIGIKRIA